MSATNNLTEFNIGRGYSVTFYPTEQLEQIETLWRELEKGKEMTYFQTYEWNKMLRRYIPIKCPHYVFTYAVVRRKQEAVMIAPLWLTHFSGWRKVYNRTSLHKCTFIGCTGFSDYLNFIYSTFDEAALDTLFVALREVFGIRLYHLNCLKEKSSSYQYIRTHCPIHSSEREICVSLALPNDKEQYLKMLSKSARQNIRTAYNRLSTDGLTLTTRFCDESVERELCNQIRNEKMYLRSLKSQPKTRIQRLQQSLNFRLKRMPVLLRSMFVPELPAAKPYCPIDDDPCAQFLTNTRDEELAAFFCYGHDSAHHEVVVMAAGTAAAYYRYSPGIIAMYEFILHHISLGDIRTIDFTRGNESYKYQLGGQEHYIYDLTFNI